MRRSWRALAACALAASAGAAAACSDSSYRGSWEVVDYRRPSVSMLGDLEAQAVLGAVLDVTASRATLGQDTCVIEETTRQTLAVRDLEMAYDLARGELGLTEEMVEMVDIRCGEGQLDFGQQLIRVGADSLMTPWGGIFLLLRKRPS
jgi:hypothetical protein